MTTPKAPTDVLQKEVERLRKALAEISMDLQSIEMDAIQGQLYSQQMYSLIVKRCREARAKIVSAETPSEAKPKEESGTCEHHWSFCSECKCLKQYGHLLNEARARVVDTPKSPPTPEEKEKVEPKPDLLVCEYSPKRKHLEDIVHFAKAHEWRCLFCHEPIKKVDVQKWAKDDGAVIYPSR